MTDFFFIFSHIFLPSQVMSKRASIYIYCFQACFSPIRSLGLGRNLGDLGQPLFIVRILTLKFLYLRFHSLDCPRFQSTIFTAPGIGLLAPEGVKNSKIFYLGYLYLIWYKMFLNRYSHLMNFGCYLCRYVYFHETFASTIITIITYVSNI